MICIYLYRCVSNTRVIGYNDMIIMNNEYLFCVISIITFYYHYKYFAHDNV